VLFIVDLLQRLPLGIDVPEIGDDQTLVCDHILDGRNGQLGECGTDGGRCTGGTGTSTITLHTDVLGYTEEYHHTGSRRWDPREVREDITYTQILGVARTADKGRIGGYERSLEAEGRHGDQRVMIIGID
jgi:hypothetical protein